MGHQILSLALRETNIDRGCIRSEHYGEYLTKEEDYSGRKKTE
jgi:hypothetical protein